MIKLFHKHKFKITQRTYSVLYTYKWIIYDINYCKCGVYKLIKCCGTLELKDIPEHTIIKTIKELNKSI